MTCHKDGGSEMEETVTCCHGLDTSDPTINLVKEGKAMKQSKRRKLDKKSWPLTIRLRILHTSSHDIHKIILLILLFIHHMGSIKVRPTRRKYQSSGSNMTTSNTFAPSSMLQLQNKVPHLVVHHHHRRQPPPPPHHFCHLGSPHAWAHQHPCPPPSYSKNVIIIKVFMMCLKNSAHNSLPSMTSKKHQQQNYLKKRSFLLLKQQVNSEVPSHLLWFLCIPILSFCCSCCCSFILFVTWMQK